MAGKANVAMVRVKRNKDICVNNLLQIKSHGDFAHYGFKGSHLACPHRAGQILKISGNEKIVREIIIIVRHVENDKQLSLFCRRFM